MNNVQLRVGDLLYAAFKRWKMILALGLLGFICGFALSGVSYLQGNYTSYEISCSIAITSQSSTGAFTNNSSYLSTNDFHLAEDMVDAASFVMKSNRVLQAALDSTGLVSVSTKDVYQNLEVSRYNETQVLQLTLSWNNADAGIRLMNAILDASRTILPETLMVGSVAVIDAPEAKYLMGGGSYAINGIPSGIEGLNPVELVRNMVHTAMEKGNDVKEEVQTILASTLARAAAIVYGQVLSNEEMSNLVDNLFACPSPNYTPDGKTVLATIKEDDIEKLFSK